VLTAAGKQASILSNVDSVVSVVITLKTFYPKADVGSVLQQTPKLLLKSLEQIQQDAQQVGCRTCANNSR